jgi:hypothetical protein
MREQGIELGGTLWLLVLVHLPKWFGALLMYIAGYFLAVWRNSIVIGVMRECAQNSAYSGRGAHANHAGTRVEVSSKSWEESTVPDSEIDCCYPVGEVHAKSHLAKA